MSVEQDFEQIIKRIYLESENALDLQLLGAAVSSGTELDANQVLKMVFDIVANQLKVVEP